MTDCMVTRILVDQRGRVTGVEFNHDGSYYQQKAKVVIVSAFAVETPRLLLNSACSQFPQGLANSSGLVGKYLMPHSGHDVYARFEEEVRLYKGTPVLAVSQDFYETDLTCGFIRGYSSTPTGARPVGMAVKAATNAGIWGQRLREIMLNWNYYARITMVGEVRRRPRTACPSVKKRTSTGWPGLRCISPTEKTTKSSSPTASKNARRSWRRRGKGSLCGAGQRPLDGWLPHGRGPQHVRGEPVLPQP